jgi:murein DD-endopeptidase MepM/ murein hydrolase activator NlpD
MAIGVVAVTTAWSACSTPAERTPRRGATPRRDDIVLATEMAIVNARIAPGATLASLLRLNDVAEPDVSEAVVQAGALFDLRKVRASQPYHLERLLDGSLRRFDYEVDRDRVLRLRREDDTLVAALEPIAKTRRIEVVRGRIDRGSASLFAAVDAAGEAIDLSVAMADVLGGEIDFSTELQPGDEFELLIEKQYRDEDGAFAGYGPILAAEFDNDGRRVRAVRFVVEGGSPDYYDQHGVSMRRFFLRSPLKFEPLVTSAFSSSRFHPILREYRPHLGVDYRAPSGAPVVAVADGVVVEAAMSGGAGRLVHLRHANGFESEYLHLSAIAVRVGAHVRQGDLIGRVGSSGLATGPHLDYRMKRNGVFVNPLAVHRAMPPAEPVPSAQMTAFQAARDQFFSRISTATSRTADRPQSRSLNRFRRTT